VVAREATTCGFYRRPGSALARRQPVLDSQDSGDTPGSANEQLRVEGRVDDTTEAGLTVTETVTEPGSIQTRRRTHIRAGGLAPLRGLARDVGPR
jgi:hypothetical protein